MNIADIVQAVSAGMNKTLTAEQVANMPSARWSSMRPFPRFSP